MPNTKTGATVSRLERGACPTCGLDVALRKGGLIREHTHNGAKCEGSGQPAATDSATGDPAGAAGDAAYDQANAAGATPAEAAAAAADAIAAARAEVKPSEAAMAALDAEPGFDAEVAHQVAAEQMAQGARPSEAAIAGATAGRKAAKKAPAAPAAGDAPVLLRLPLEMIDANPRNPRGTDLGTDEELAELGNSIATRGLVEPVVGRRTADGRVELIAGGRRLEAARRHGAVAELDIIIRDADDATAFELALIENAMRKDLEPIQEARAYQTLVDEYGYTQLRLAERLGRSQGHVSRRLSLLKLPERIQDAVGTRLNVRDAEDLAKQPAKIVEKAWDTAQAAQPADPGRALPGAIREVKQADERDRAQTKALKTLRDAGVRIIDTPNSGYTYNLPEGVEGLEDLEDRILTEAQIAQINDTDGLTDQQIQAIYHDAHHACPGHAAYAYRGDITYVCTNAAELHPETAAGAGTVDAELAKRRAENERWDTDRTAATATRLLVMKDLLAKRTSAAGTVQIITAYLETQDDNSHYFGGIKPEARRAMADLLGYDVGPQARWVDMLEATVPERGLLTVSLALAMAAGDLQLLNYRRGDALAPNTIRHLRFLEAEAGYQLAEWEAEAIENSTAAGADEVDTDEEAREAAAYETMTGPSVDDWEDPEAPAGAMTAEEATAAADRLVAERLKGEEAANPA